MILCSIILRGRGSHIFGSHENTETRRLIRHIVRLHGSHIFGSHENTETYVCVDTLRVFPGHISSVHTRTLKRIEHTERTIQKTGHISSVHTRTLKQSILSSLMSVSIRSHIFGSHENTETHLSPGQALGGAGHISSVHTRTLKR